MTLSADPVVGIDVSKDKLDDVFLADDTQAHKKFTNTPAGFKKLSQWIQRRTPEPIWICLEAIGTYADAVATYLHEQEYKVSIINPAQIKAFVKSQLQRNKTDKLDAEMIARFARVNDLRQWTPPPPEWSELRAIMRRLDDLKAMQQKERNRLQTVLDPRVRQSVTDTITFIQRQIAELEQALHDHLDNHPHLKKQYDLLISIPGVGHWTACAILAEIRDFSIFTSVKELVAYAGLNPRQHQSGRLASAYTPISKVGNARLRKALYMASLSAAQFNPILHTFYERLKAAGKSTMVARVAVMRKLLHLAYGILKHQQPFDPFYGQVSA